jgi:hypothetical protein
MIGFLLRDQKGRRKNPPQPFPTFPCLCITLRHVSDASAFFFVNLESSLYLKYLHLSQRERRKIEIPGSSLKAHSGSVWNFASMQSHDLECQTFYLA